MAFYRKTKLNTRLGCFSTVGSEPSLQAERPIPSAGAIVILCRKE